VLFAFDKSRMAILLLGGDTSDNGSGWYAQNIPIADERFESIKKRSARRSTQRASGAWMSIKSWEKNVLAKPGAAARVAEIEDELRLAAGLTALREQAGLSQRDLAKRLGVSQPRIAAIERSKNVTVELLVQYVEALGGRLHVTVVRGNQRTTLISAGSPVTKNTRTTKSATKIPAKAASRRAPTKRARQPA